MKVLYLIDTRITIPGDSGGGGTERQLYLLASSLDPDIFEPIVVQMSSNEVLTVTRDYTANVRLFHLPVARIYTAHSLFQLGRLIRLARSENVDIIHTYFEKAELCGWLTMRLSGKPAWVTSRRDLGFKRKRIYDLIFRLALRDCSKCIAVCNAVKDKIISSERVPRYKIKVIYNGLDATSFQMIGRSNSLRNELGINCNTPLVGMVANFNYEIKGHYYFLEAAKRVLQTIPEVEFILIGDGALRKKYQELSRQSGLTTKVHFLGRRANSVNILSNLTVSVLCSTSEGLSNVLLESMAAGTPVVATRVGGNPEAVLDGITGYLVPPKNTQALARAIISLLLDPQKASAMGVAAKKRVKETFSLEAMVRSYEQLYQLLVS